MSKKINPNNNMSNKRKPTNNIAIISFHDLWAMYQFIKSESGVFINPPNLSEAALVVKKRLGDIERELYERTYGFNPWTLNTWVIEGEKPEDIDLGKFDIKE